MRTGVAIAEEHSTAKKTIKLSALLKTILSSPFFIELYVINEIQWHPQTYWGVLKIENNKKTAVPTRATAVIFIWLRPNRGTISIRPQSHTCVPARENTRVPIPIDTDGAPYKCATSYRQVF
jgi:hypothetical protein